ncbi:MAG TPA: SigE family RNA polymerase sigma factor [Mycobacteriales bacterium]|jgi:RNA polymerase sigma-70 factor (sigma-E family)
MGTTFEEWVGARTPALMRTAYLLTGDWQRAEDLLQTALMRCYGRWDRIDEHEAYVRRALVTTYAGWRRRRWVGELPGPVPDGAAPRDDAADSDARADVLRLLASLPPRQRAVVVLRYYEDLPEATIADLLGVSRGTVKSTAAKALARLRTSPLLIAEHKP